MLKRSGLAGLGAATAVLLAACSNNSPNEPHPKALTPQGVTAAPGNGQAMLAWNAVHGARGYNVYSAPSSPVGYSSAKTSVGTTAATLGGLANGTPVYAAVTAVNPGVESALSAEVCAVPTAGSTAGVTLYDPLCERALDGSKWQTPLFSRRVSDGALELGIEAGNMEGHRVRGAFYQTSTSVSAAGRRVTTIQTDVMVPAAGAARTPDSGARLHVAVNLLYQPPAMRLSFPGGAQDRLLVQVGLIEVGGGLRAYRRALHCDVANCTVQTSTGVALTDPAGFGLVDDRADAPASYDTTYTMRMVHDEATGIFTWSIAGGEFGSGVTGTADPSAYLAGNANWSALGPKPLAGPGFTSAGLGSVIYDESTSGGASARLTTRFGNVYVGFNNAPTVPWDDFSGVGGNSGPVELSPAKWTTAGASSTALSAGSLVTHVQATSVSTRAIGNYQALTFGDPERINTLQADVTPTDCSATDAPIKVVQLAGGFYNDGTPGTIPPTINQPYSAVGDVRAYLALNCVTNEVRFSIQRIEAAGVTQLSNYYNNLVSSGATVGNRHTLRMAWNPAGHTIAFQADGSAPVVVDPTTLNAYMMAAAPYVKPANAPLKLIQWGVYLPASSVATAGSLDVRVNNVFAAP